MADVDFGDLIDYLDNDVHTRAILDVKAITINDVTHDSTLAL